MKLLLAGGGTAGHVEPAIAVARGWKASHPNDEVVFLGTRGGLENTLVPAAGFTLAEIPKVSIARKLSPSLLRVPGQLLASIVVTMRHLQGVDCAIGFGGYVSAPLYIAAALKRIPLVIHEQNARPGWANRMGARFTRFTAISYPVTAGLLAKAELTGLPLRRDVIAAVENSANNWEKARSDAKRRIAARYELDSSRALIFIFGGSQGSQAINNVIAGARENLESAGFSILHGVGKNNPLPAPSSNYRAISYIDEMAQCYLAADLLISRSGAVTCAEAAALARYSLFIPLPIGNGEQALNAQALASAGRAEILAQSNFTSDWLVANIDSLIASSRKLPADGDASGIAAVDKIVALIERAAGNK